MSVEVVPFAFRGEGVRTLLIDGLPWFVANDVTRVLGYKNGRDAVSRHTSASQRRVSRITTPSGEQYTTLLSEGGVWRLVMRSNAPGAVAFQDWLADDVIPALMKTGSYSVAPVIDVSTPQGVLALAEQLTVTARELVAANDRVKELEPAAAQAATFRQAEGLRNLGDLANDLKVYAAANLPGVRIRHEDVFDQAGRLGLIIRGNTTRNNQPTARAIEAGWVRPKETVFSTNTRGTQVKLSTRLTPRGYGRLWDGCLSHIAEHGTLTVGKVVAV